MSFRFKTNSPQSDADKMWDAHEHAQEGDRRRRRAAAYQAGYRAPKIDDMQDKALPWADDHILPDLDGPEGSHPEFDRVIRTLINQEKLVEVSKPGSSPFCAARSYVASAAEQAVNAARSEILSTPQFHKDRKVILARLLELEEALDAFVSHVGEDCEEFFYFSDDVSDAPPTDDPVQDYKDSVDEMAYYAHVRLDKAHRAASLARQRIHKLRTTVSELQKETEPRDAFRDAFLRHAALSFFLLTHAWPKKTGMSVFEDFVVAAWHMLRLPDDDKLRGSVRRKIERGAHLGFKPNDANF